METAITLELGTVILELVRERLPKRFGLAPIRDIQVLCPMNRGGLECARSMWSCRKR